MHMGGGPAIAAHLSTRPTPTTAETATRASIDHAPLTNEAPGRRGSGFPSPDAPAGQKLITRLPQQGNSARREGLGVATSSAPMLPASKTTTDVAAACAGDLMMVFTLLPSQLDNLL